MKKIRNRNSKMVFLGTLSCLFSIGMQAQTTTQSNNTQETKSDDLSFQDLKQMMKYKFDYKKSNLAAKGVSKAPPERPKNDLNPLLSMGGNQGKSQVWLAYMEALGKYKASQNRNLQTPNYYNEKEKGGTKTNNTNPEKVSFSAVINGEDPTPTIIQGALGDGVVFNNPVEISTEENNNWFGAATALPPLVGLDTFVRVSSVLEPYEINGALSGDVDMFSYTFPANEAAVVEIKPDVTNTNAQLFLVVFDQFGTPIEIVSGPPSQPFVYGSPKSAVDRNVFLLIIEVRTLDTIITGAEFADPNTIYALHPTVSYDLSITNVNTETDSYEVALKKGDVFGLVSTNSVILSNTLLKPNGEVGISTSSYFKDTSIDKPLPVNGNSGLEYVVPEDGNYTIVLEGIGAYATEFATAKPRIDGQRTQYIYLDFTGVDDFTQRAFFGVSEDEVPIGVDPVLDAVRTLSPMRSFLENWGIENTRINTIRLAQQITDIVKENLERDFIESGINPDFNVRILSDYGIDRLGVRLPNVLENAGIAYSRIIVGGSIAESGITTIGIASSLDVGNYREDDDALALLDIVSVEQGGTLQLPDGRLVSDRSSFNIIELGGSASKMDLVATGVANLISHEAGHYLGNFHTDSQNDVLSIMNEGQAGIFKLTGLQDNTEVFGIDNIDLDFVKDSYSQFEGASGLDETDVNTAFGLTSRRNKASKAQPDVELEKLENLESEALAELYQIVPGGFFAYNSSQGQGKESTLVVTAKVSGPATISMYDLQGRMISEIYNGNLEAGTYKEFAINHAQLNLKTGVYIYKMTSIAGESTYKTRIQ